MPRSASFLFAVCLVLLASGCARDSEPLSQDPDWRRGRAIYIANCVACHNSDPSKEGPIGPAVKGSPPELLEARVLRTDYPPGYTPKRDTTVMPTFPFLKNEIRYLAVYLNNEASPHEAQQQNHKDAGQNKP
jgi:mono/diheme cytochrome c family protein